MFACLYRPPAADRAADAGVLVAIADAFSPRYELHGDDCVVIDVRGLERMFQTYLTIARELHRHAREHGIDAHVALAFTQAAAQLLALAAPGVTFVEPGAERERLASLPLDILQGSRALFLETSALSLETLKKWGLRTLGDFAALPAADLTARLGQTAACWQALARGDDRRPLVPMRPDERFESALDLEWPIEGIEPLSFVLTRLIDPLSLRLERRDRGAAALHLELRLVTRALYVRRLELPAPMRDTKTLRTLLTLDLESHPPPAAIDRVLLIIEPTPGRIVQHTLFARPQPAPEQVSTLLARLGALMGQERVGSPAHVDTHRPGAFAMTTFRVDERTGQASRAGRTGEALRRSVLDTREGYGPSASARGGGAPRELKNVDGAVANHLVERTGHSALRRCRHPVPARVAVHEGRPIRVTTDRRGFAGGAVTACAGPWRTSTAWWETTESLGEAKGTERDLSRRRPVLDTHEVKKVGSHGVDHDEWDVALSDGAVYRIFQERDTGRWFIEGIVD